MISWTPLLPQSIRSRYFVSYRSLDRDLAEQVEARLVASGQDVWRDRKDIQTGDNWRSEIRGALGDCHDVVVLLSREAAASKQVINEIEVAIELGKRLHCFATFDVRDSPRIYRHVEHIHFELIPSVGAGSDSARIANHIVDTLLKPPRKTHPLTLRDFERRACRGVYPPFDDIWAGGRLNKSLTERYSQFAAQLVTERARCTMALVLNAGILFTHLCQWQGARSCLDSALRLESSAIGLYFKALACMRGQRPRYLGGAVTDECVAMVLKSWEQCRSPLIALLMVAVLWDSGRGRGDNLARLSAEAIRALPRVESSSNEVRRFLALIRFEDGWELPFSTDGIVGVLGQFTGDKE
jgi:hypothetical protein